MPYRYRRSLYRMGTLQVERFVCVCCLFLITLSSGTTRYQYGTVYCKNQKCSYKPNMLDVRQGTAIGTYNDTLEQTGWGILDISSGYGAESSDIDILYAAGYLEGYFTARRIYQHYQNMEDYFLNDKSDTVKEKLQRWLATQDQWTRQMARSKTDSPLWRHVAMVTAQFDGLVDGYKAAAPENESLGIFAFQVLNGAGDLLDLMKVIDPQSIPDWTKMSREEARYWVQTRGMCSALIKVLGAFEDIFMSHSSWFTYQATMRIYKHYNFNVQDKACSARKISFSSYPGFLESLDDFYHLGGNMVMLQTTNNVFNTSLYEYVTPTSLLAWQRVRVANMMAQSGKEWAKILAQYNSGTYNNQYMIIDLKRIKINKTLEDGALYVVEQIPSLVEYGDQTQILRAGYWPSYNVPFYERVYNLSGYPGFVAKHGSDFSYQLAPRAKIFRRDEGTVQDMSSMKNIMRYNDYKNDPYSEGDSCNTICCRGDLRKSEAGPLGCYDTKVSNYSMAKNLQADIINGPTLGSGLPPFEWTAAYKQSHLGLPQIYQFPFIQTKPKFHHTKLNTI